MKKLNDYFNKFLSLALIICLITSMFSGCAPVSNHPEPEIDTEAIAETITSEIQKQITETEIQTEPISDPADFSVDWFVYDRLFSEYSLVYDTFSAVLHLEDGSEISGFGYTDYSAYYETTDGENGFFPAGFIADAGGVIPSEETENGLIIENLDYTDKKYQFVYAYNTAPFMEHCVVDGRYLQYGINDAGAIHYIAEPYQRGHCEESLGALYSYDEEKFLFDPEIGTYVPITGNSVFEVINYEALEEEVNRILREQNINFSRQDVITSAHVAQEAVISYFLSLQEETFLGCNVQELVECAEALDPMECIRITPEGHIIINVDADLPETPSTMTKWLVGIVCTISTTALVATGVQYPAIMPIVKEIIPEILRILEKVIQENQNIRDIKWDDVIISVAINVVGECISPIVADHISLDISKLFQDEKTKQICKDAVYKISSSMIHKLCETITLELAGKSNNETESIDAYLLGIVIKSGIAAVDKKLQMIATKVFSHAITFSKRLVPVQRFEKLKNKFPVELNNGQRIESNYSKDLQIPKAAHIITGIITKELLCQLTH